jgi:hypothetical protein
MSPGSHDVLVSILRQHLRKLTALQAEVLKTSTFVGMTAAEGDEYNARQQHMEQIVRHIRKLEGPGGSLDRN